MAIFRRERRRRMRAEWRHLALFVGIVVALTAWVALDNGWRRTLAAFFLGFFVAILLVGWMMGFDARSLRWMWGAVGEEWTANELARLPAYEWSVYHDVPNGRGNWDHIVVGPAGVFVIDSKNFGQPARVTELGLVSGRIQCSAHKARTSAVRLKELIEERAGVTVWVQPVFAVWGDLRDGFVERDGVVYTPGRVVADVISARPNRLSRDQQAQVAAALAPLVNT
jgi:hypothetical protein